MLKNLKGLSLPELNPKALLPIGAGLVVVLVVIASLLGNTEQTATIAAPPTARPEAKPTVSQNAPATNRLQAAPTKGTSNTPLPSSVNSPLPEAWSKVSFTEKKGWCASVSVAVFFGLPNTAKAWVPPGWQNPNGGAYKCASDGSGEWLPLPYGR